MDITVYPGKLSGHVKAIPSKSQAHRLLICAAFADKPTRIICPSTNQDIEATAGCLSALGARITRTADGYHVIPVSVFPKKAVLNCFESGSTLRFMLPIAGALGVDAVFLMSGRLPQRPLSPLWEEMERMGCILSRDENGSVLCRGKLTSGCYKISGSVSSQFITGLLFAMALIKGRSCLEVTGKIESRPYIDMTCQALKLFGVSFDGFSLSGSYPFVSPGELTVEGDWSNGAFFLAAEALGSHVSVSGLLDGSFQGDKAVAQHLSALGNFTTIDGADIPDLIPILAVTAAAKKGAQFVNIGRLRLKESDRIASTAEMLKRLGASVEVAESSMCVLPAPFHSCVIDSQNDHRIAMSAAIAATAADGPVTILGAECVRKSYPDFWSEFRRVGGIYEQHVR